MEKAFGRGRAHELIEDAHRRYTEAVCDHRYRQRRQHKDDLFPRCRPVVVGKQNPHQEKRDHVAQPAACVHNLEPGEAQIDDIPLAEGGEAIELHHFHADLGRDQFQAEGEGKVERIGRHEGSQTVYQGKGDNRQFTPPEVKPAEGDDHQPEGEEQHGELAAQLAEPEQEQPRDQQVQPLPGGEGREGGQPFPLFPYEVQDYKWNYITVGKIFVLPFGEQIYQGGSVGEKEQDGVQPQSEPFDRLDGCNICYAEFHKPSKVMSATNEHECTRINALPKSCRAWMDFQFQVVSKCLAGLFEVIIRLEIHPALGIRD